MLKKSKTNLQKTFICNGYGIVEYCEASLRVHKRKKHIIQATNTQEPYKSRTTQNDITNRTLKEIIRELNKFQEFVFSYLLNFRDKDDKNPKFSSLSMLRSSIKIQLIEA